MVVSDDSLELLSKSFPNFKSLVLVSCEGFTTDVLVAIASKCRGNTTSREVLTSIHLWSWVVTREPIQCLITQLSIYVSAVVSLHLHATAISVFNVLNFSEWREQVNHLGLLDLDLALLEEKSVDITDISSDAKKLKHKIWDMSNKLCLNFMRMTIANNIETTLPESVTAKEYLKLVEEHFHFSDKSLAGTLMVELTTIK
ncbi:hypothetical protein BUALT_Bualt13G0077800 [Buddleja alternifolia]|uniref:Uncharacterized protein n=1 Tax=Buddleja alternifolia TaxID=168488 RepID=A0AAV6WMC6_9LAMI|nr:hypothetical protein BUALT_Bualt13G0077800 [Buddleja alternifolia]